MINFKTRYLSSYDIRNAVDEGADMNTTPLFDISVSRETMVFIKKEIEKGIKEAANADDFKTVITLADSLQDVRETIEEYDEMVKTRRAEITVPAEAKEGETDE